VKTAVCRRGGWLAAWFAAFFLAAVPALIHAADAAEVPDLTPLFQRVARELSVSPALLRAIASVESKGHPHALNIAGKAFFFASQKEAIAAAKAALSAGKSFDSGIMQINSQWLRRFSIPLAALFDPEANIWFGGWILAQNISQYGGIDQAVARYHSTDPERGKRYVRLVLAALEKEERNNAPGKSREQSEINGSNTSENGFVRRMSETLRLESVYAAETSGFIRRYDR
jgi:soluble lytic murein transglycosylase-like protein